MASSVARRTLTSTIHRLRYSSSLIFPHTRHDHPQHPTGPQGPLPTHCYRERSSLYPFYPLASHLSLRSYSSIPGGPDGVENLLGETAAEVGPVLGEVAAAAADSAPPVAALQHLIDAVHSFTGLNWWAAIAVTTLLIRCAMLPLLIHQLKATSKLIALKPEIEELKEQLQHTADPQIVQENQQKIKELFNKHGVSPFTPLKGIFIQGPVFVSFYLAISNMVEKVDSFKEGGVVWFTDLTTPDPFYAFPILTGMTFLVTVEMNLQEGMEGNPMAGNMKIFSRLLAFLTVPFTASFPKAIFCYWITSNFFSLIYGAVLKHPPVRKFLDLPALAARPAVVMQPSLPFLSGLKYDSGSPSPLLIPPSEPSQRRVSSSVIQRIQTLEKTVKGKKKSKNKKSTR